MPGRYGLPVCQRGGDAAVMVVASWPFSPDAAASAPKGRKASPIIANSIWRMEISIVIAIDVWRAASQTFRNWRSSETTRACPRAEADIPRPRSPASGNEAFWPFFNGLSPEPRAPDERFRAGRSWLLTERDNGGHLRGPAL